MAGRSFVHNLTMLNDLNCSPVRTPYTIARMNTSRWLTVLASSLAIYTLLAAYQVLLHTFMDCMDNHDQGDRPRKQLLVKPDYFNSNMYQS